MFSRYKRELSSMSELTAVARVPCGSSMFPWLEVSDERLDSGLTLPLVWWVGTGHILFSVACEHILISFKIRKKITFRLNTAFYYIIIIDLSLYPCSGQI